MAEIFLCYRREDSPGHTGRLKDRLRVHFGDDTVLIDIDVVEPGIDWVETIKSTVSACDVSLAVIGPSWLTSVNEDGIRSIEDPEDYVHVEIATALSQGIRTIPVLVAGATMPAARDLPEDLRRLARRRAYEVSDKRWDYDVGQLILLLERIISVSAQEASVAAEEPVESETADNHDSQHQSEEPYIPSEEPVENVTEQSAAAELSPEEPYVSPEGAVEDQTEDTAEEPSEQPITVGGGTTEPSSGEKRRLSAMNVLLSIVAASAIVWTTAVALEQFSFLLTSVFRPRLFSPGTLLLSVVVGAVGVAFLVKSLGHRAVAMSAVLVGAAIDLFWGTRYRGGSFPLRVLPDVLLAVGVLWIWHRLRRRRREGAN